jgi:hypothetical protein
VHEILISYSISSGNSDYTMWSTLQVLPLNITRYTNKRKSFTLSLLSYLCLVDFNC